MKDRIKSILVCLTVLLLINCFIDNKEHPSLGENLALDSLIYTMLIEDTVKPDFGVMTIVQYYDSTGCISCKMQLREWDNLLYEFQQDSMLLPVTFVMIVYTDTEYDVCAEIKYNHFGYPVSLIKDDTLFENVGVYSSSCFLLDTNGTILEYGSPLQNEKIKREYKNHLRIEY